MDEIFEASIFIGENIIIELDYPKLKIVNGEIIIDSYIINKNHGYENDDIHYKELQRKFRDKSLIIKAITSSGSKLDFNRVYLTSCSYPSFEFSFKCFDNQTEYILCNEDYRIETFNLCALVVEGIEIQYTNSSEIKRKRFMFGIDDSCTLSFQLDNMELDFHFFNKKRHYDLKIGLIEPSDKSNSILIKFYGENLLPYRIYNLFKKSLNYFLSYLAGNNVIIREETFTVNHQNYITKTYSFKNLAEVNKNHFLPVFDIHFRHDRILEHYLNSLPNYLLIDKHLNLSEIVYLVNQSKHVNMESSFFILLIAIEKLATNLINSNLIETRNNFIIEDDLFQQLKSDLLSNVEVLFKNNGLTKKQIEDFKTKLGNLNVKNKTDSKIDVLLDYCEIKRTEEINSLFPKLRNLAIHEGEISFSDNEAHTNYKTLFVLVNSLICNLIQYKGTRFIEHKNKTNYIAKKEVYKTDYKKYDKNSFPD